MIDTLESWAGGAALLTKETTALSEKSLKTCQNLVEYILQEHRIRS